MEKRPKAFARFAVFTLGFNILVILWGVFLRASRSGDGCGQHWLTCQGEVIPSAPQIKTIIEFSHRIMSALDGALMLILLGWAGYIFLFSEKDLLGKQTAHAKRVFYASLGSFIFVITEAAVGAGLVLTGNTADALTDARPFWAIGHLINTFILLAFLTATVWFANTGREPLFRAGTMQQWAMQWAVIAAGIIGIFIIGSSGVIAALGSMLFPAHTLIDGLTRDFSPDSHILLRLRLLHPVLSIFISVYLLFATGWMRARSGNEKNVLRWTNIVSILIVVQIAFGAATLLSFGPIVMQIGHLLLADAVWISFVTLCLNFLSADNVRGGASARTLP